MDMKKINMKRLLIVVIFISALLFGLILGFAKLINYYRIKNAKVYIVLSDTLKTEVYSDVHIGDFIEEINGDIIDNKKIDTTRLGKQKIEFKYINEDNIKIPYNYELDIVDETKPIISSYSELEVYEGDSDFYKDIFCGDNYDSHPKCYIDGDYNINKKGKYKVKFKGEDTSGNVATQKLKLIVKEKPKPSKKSKSSSTKSSSDEEKSTKFKNVVKDYKKKNVKVGIDVSKWQGDIDFKKVKESGVEFAIIKVGGDFMEIIIRGDKVKITSAMKEYIEEKLAKLEKYLDEDFPKDIIRAKGYLWFKEALSNVGLLVKTPTGFSYIFKPSANGSTTIVDEESDIIQ